MNAELPPRRQGARSSRGLAWAPRTHAAWIAEMAVLFVLVLVLDQGMRPGFELLEAAPHPFWVPVIAMAAFYGLTPGLAAAGLGALLLGWTEPALSPARADHFLQWMHFWKEPVLWLLAALALGLHRDREVALRRELEADLAAAEARGETIAAYATTLRSHVGRLEREAALAPSRGSEGGRDESAPRPSRRPGAHGFVP